MTDTISEHNKIPNHWHWVTLDDIGIIVSGGTPSTKEPEFWNGDIPWITPADLSNFEEIYISKGNRSITKVGLENSAATLVPQNTVLFSSRAPIGYVAIAKNDLATNQGFKNLIVFSEYCDPKYIYYYLRTIKELAENMASGTTFLEISSSKFKQIPFPLTTVTEQRFIVNKIEEIISELDKNIISLKESKLKIDLIKTKTLENLIVNSNKDRVELQTLTKSITYGLASKSYRNKKGNSLLYLRITDIQDGKIDWKNVPYCDVTDTKIIQQYKLTDGDILFARSGNTTGKSVLIKNPRPSLFASYLIRIRLNHSIISDSYLAYFMQTDFYWKQIQDGISGIGQPNFNATKLSHLIVPICSLNEQEKIVEHLESTFLEIDKMKNEIELNIQNTNLLKAKVLSDAFLGKLSIEIKGDESITAMLKNIQVAKEFYLKESAIKAKSTQKSKISNLDLYQIIKDRYIDSPFSYQDIFRLSKVSKQTLSKKFDELKSKKLIQSYFDEVSEVIKYKIV